jgi:hypothetical protein
MAIRSVYFIKENKVLKDDIEIKWASGFAFSQKQKNIISLHDAITQKYKVSSDQILEVSTKSPLELGKMLSSINLKFRFGEKYYFFESVYQSSKVFSDGLLGTIHHPEWIELESFAAKKASQSLNLPLVEFKYDSQSFPLEPKTMFFDWLYINCIHQLNIKFLIDKYHYFTDIEFNPTRMISTQAHALCLYKHLANNNLVEMFLNNPRKFYE